jgi:hypothetical protein
MSSFCGLPSFDRLLSSQTPNFATKAYHLSFHSITVIKSPASDNFNKKAQNDHFRGSVSFNDHHFQRFPFQ